MIVPYGLIPAARMISFDRNIDRGHPSKGDTS
jgi:hypothetical protein